MVGDGDPDFVDAGDAEPGGGGAYTEDEYFSVEFPDWLMEFPIHVKEMWIVIVSLKLWGLKWSKIKVVLYCDNDPCVDTWINLKPKDEKLKNLLRELVFLVCKFNILLEMRKISSADNKMADFISRCHDEKKIDRFLAENKWHDMTGSDCVKKRVLVDDILFKFAANW